jgi:hypothetical protein
MSSLLPTHENTAVATSSRATTTHATSAVCAPSLALPRQDEPGRHDCYYEAQQQADDGEGFEQPGQVVSFG